MQAAGLIFSFEQSLGLSQHRSENYRELSGATPAISMYFEVYTKLCGVKQHQGATCHCKTQSSASAPCSTN